MTRLQRGWILIAVVLIAAFLAFPLRETIYQLVVVPAAFIIWHLDLLYRSFSQGIWWWVIVVLVVFFLLLSLLPQRGYRPRAEQKSKQFHGQVEALAGWLRKAENGIYFKWMVANRLGKLAYQMLLHRESGRPRSVFTPLVGADWEPGTELQQYLETGLHGSFADYPGTSRLAPHTPTPLDLNVAEAVAFLESKIEDGRVRHSP